MAATHSSYSASVIPLRSLRSRAVRLRISDHAKTAKRSQKNSRAMFRSSGSFAIRSVSIVPSWPSQSEMIGFAQAKMATKTLVKRSGMIHAATPRASVGENPRRTSQRTATPLSTKSRVHPVKNHRTSRASQHVMSLSQPCRLITASALRHRSIMVTLSQVGCSKSARIKPVAASQAMRPPVWARKLVSRMAKTASIAAARRAAFQPRRWP
jgi:hypothetical protein